MSVLHRRSRGRGKAPRLPGLVPLPEGTPLHHGTRCVGTFAVPDGPAWFAFNHEAAAGWAGWSQVPPRGRVHGPERVLSYVAGKDVLLFDTSRLEDWQALGLALLGDDDPLTEDLARAVRDAGYAGWYGRAEIMLTAPADGLTPVEAPDAGPGPR